MVFSGNPLIIATVLVVLVFVVVGLVLAWYWDREELVRSSLVPLCGKDGPFRYEVLVFTGRLFGSGKRIVFWLFINSKIFSYVTIYTRDNTLQFLYRSSC